MKIRRNILFRLSIVLLLMSGIIISPVEHIVANAQGIVDEFSSSSSEWLLFKNKPETPGSFTYRSGVLSIDAEPHDSQDTIGVEKIFQGKFGDGKWVHFKIRRDNIRFGSNFYAHFFVDKNPSTNEGWNRLFSVHHNGASMWKYSNDCSLKSALDEFSLSLGDMMVYPKPPEYWGRWAYDFRSDFPANVRPSLDSWILYSVKYESSSEMPRIRFFINGREISYRNPDDGSNIQILDTRTYQKISSSADHEIKIRFENASDGSSYKFPKNYRDQGCYANETPAWPSRADGSPYGHTSGAGLPATISIEYILIGNGRDGDFDKNYVKTLITSGGIPGGTSAAIFLEMISWQDAQFTCPYMSEAEKNEVRAHPLGSSSFCR